MQSSPVASSGSRTRSLLCLQEGAQASIGGGGGGHDVRFWNNQHDPDLVLDLLSSPDVPDFNPHRRLP